MAERKRDSECVCDRKNGIERIKNRNIKREMLRKAKCYLRESEEEKETGTKEKKMFEC